jgi:hypothetical protein
VLPVVTFNPSHEADSTSDHVNVPPVEFERLIVVADGFPPPAVPEKLIAVGLTEILDVEVIVPFVTFMVIGTVAV